VSAEVFVCKRMCQETGGEYSVALNEGHLQELMLALAPPPPAIANQATAELVGDWAAGSVWLFCRMRVLAA
jgi:transcription initiation factor TFIIH subunit 2